MSESDIDFRKLEPQSKLKTFKVPTDLTFKKRKETIKDDNNNDSPITLARELENKDNDILTRIIVHTENQLGSVIKEFNLNYSIITTRIMFDN